MRHRTCIFLALLLTLLCGGAPGALAFAKSAGVRGGDLPSSILNPPSSSAVTYHYDYRGSTIAMSGGNSLVTDRMEYAAYGLPTYRAGTNDTPFLFNGRYGVMTDPNGLLAMNVRYYNPFLCRFISADPSGFSGGLNWYAYANGNPVGFVDPFGLGAVSESSVDLSWFNAPTPAETQTQEALASFANFATLGLANLASAPTGYDFGAGLGDNIEQSLKFGGFVGASMVLAALTDGGSLEAEAEAEGEALQLTAGTRAAEEGGMANLHYYSPESLGQEAPHFSVETLGEGGMHTHQVITGPTSTTMVPVEGLPSPTGTIPVSLADPAAAQALQAQRLGAQLGPYNMRNNSCLTTAADILRAGGADIPANNIQLRIWVKGKLQ